MKTYYIVYGSTGEWSDRLEWPVRVFPEELKAQEFIQKLEHEYTQFSQEKGFYRDKEERNKLYSTMKKLDIRFNESYTGTYYFLEECKGET